MSVPPGSTLVARLLGTTGQQVPELWATVTVQTTQDVPNGAVRVYLRTPTAWCLGAGLVSLDLRAGVERTFTTFNVSKAETDPTGICPLPYTTTEVEVVATDSMGQELARASASMIYNFVAP